MLLTVDIGNTNIKFAVFDAGTLALKVAAPTSRSITAEQLTRVLSGRLTASIDRAIVCSVVPEANGAVQEYIERNHAVEAAFVENDWDFGLTILQRPLSDAGTDRLVNCYAAVQNYGAPCIVCSFGTALTIDVVDEARTLTGTVIAPGMRVMSASLASLTSQLPEGGLAQTPVVLQQTTLGAVTSGITHGFAALAHGLISKVIAESGISKVIATGGHAQFAAANIPEITHTDPDLLLHGLQMLDSGLRGQQGPSTLQ